MHAVPRYYNDVFQEGNFSSTVVDADLDFAWVGGKVTAESADIVGAQFQTFFKPPQDGYYTFTLTGNDRARVWMDGKLFMNLDESGTIVSPPTYMTTKKLPYMHIMYQDYFELARLVVEYECALCATPIRKVPIPSNDLYSCNKVKALFPMVAGTGIMQDCMEGGKEGWEGGGREGGRGREVGGRWEEEGGWGGGRGIRMNHGALFQGESFTLLQHTTCTTRSSACGVFRGLFMFGTSPARRRRSTAINRRA